MRVLWLLLWIALVAAIVWSLLRRRAPRIRRPAAPDVLVKDPVCQTYVLRSQALAWNRSAEPVYFCSAECAQRYTGPAGR